MWCVADAHYLSLANTEALGQPSVIDCGVLFQSFFRLRYRGREHAFSFGITLSFCRGGNTLASYVSPLVANAYGVAAALWVGAGICLFCVLCTIPLIILDVRAEKRIEELQLARGAAEN